MERVLGRALQEDEEVSIMAFSPHDAPTGVVLQVLARKIEERVNETAERVKDVPDNELEEAINEAVNHVRPHPR